MLHTQPRPTEMPETVFIVDDDEAVRDSLQWLIETEGYQVKTFEDPELFLSQLQWPQPGVLLLDIRMPKMSGIEVQKILNERGIPIPIVFITGLFYTRFTRFNTIKSSEYLYRQELAGNGEAYSRV